MFSWFRKKYLSSKEADIVVQAIQQAEKNTSGEIRVYIEGKCKEADALNRAIRLFYRFQMQATKEKNAVLLYIAMKDHKLAVYGDEGIHEKVGTAWWNERVNGILQRFSKTDYATGIAECVLQIGEALKEHFPYNKDTDKNELSDTVIFGG